MQQKHFALIIFCNETKLWNFVSLVSYCHFVVSLVIIQIVILKFIVCIN